MSRYSTPAALRHSRNSRKSGGRCLGSIVQLAQILQVPEALLRRPRVPEGALRGVRFRKRTGEADDGLDEALTHNCTLAQTALWFNSSEPSHTELLQAWATAPFTMSSADWWRSSALALVNGS